MPLSPYNLEERPYNVCLNCVHIGKNCDGPNFLAMDTDRWCEWCRLRKEYLGWTNAKVADLAGISKISVDRIMSGNVKDLRNTTMQSVTKALVNGTWGQYPCAMPALHEAETVYVDNPVLIAKLEEAQNQCEYLRRNIDVLREEYRLDLSIVSTKESKTLVQMSSQISFMEDHIRSKDKMMEEQRETIKAKDRLIKQLVTSLAIIAMLLMAFLLFNIARSDTGFFLMN